MQGAKQPEDISNFSWLTTFLTLALECDFPIIEAIYLARQPLDFEHVLSKLPKKIDLTLPCSMDLLTDAFRACNWVIHQPYISVKSFKAKGKTKILFQMWPRIECGPLGGFFFRESKDTVEISISFKFNSDITSLWIRKGFNVGENLLNLPSTLPHVDMLMTAHRFFEK